MEDIQHQQMGYDRSATMFAPDGHILQVEYAEKIVRLGSASIGIVCKDSVVIVADRRQRDRLLVEESANRINEIDEHLMVVFAGITSDARVLIERARVLAQQHQVTYDSPPSTEAIVRDVADIKQQFTQYSGARPFGVSMMFAGVDGKPALYTTDITGNYLKYKANAVGEDDEKIKKLLRERYVDGMTSREGIKLALNIFREVLGNDFNIGRFDAGILSEKGIEKLSLAEFQ